MANRERNNELKIYLSDDEQFILEQKVKASGITTLTIPNFGNTMLRLAKSETI